jgi:hypothetical protein
MRETLTSLDLPDAAALVAFSNGAETLIPRDDEGYWHSRVVYVRDDEGNNLQGARFERERLSDGSFVYNLVLAFDREPALPAPVAQQPAQVVWREVDPVREAAPLLLRALRVAETLRSHGFTAGAARMLGDEAQAVHFREGSTGLSRWSHRLMLDAIAAAGPQPRSRALTAMPQVEGR